MNELKPTIGSLNLDEATKDFIQAIKDRQQLTSLYEILKKQRHKNVLIEGKFRRQFGFELTGLLPTVIQHFYEMGKEDTLKELESQKKEFKNPLIRENTDYK